MNGHENAVATQILASNCCFCGRELRDAESVQRGIGPICKGKYAIGDITAEGLKAAMGVVAFSEFDLGSDLVAKILERRHAGGKDAGRQIANLVIYHASARRAEPLFVLKCAEVLDAVGYGIAGTQLRKNYARIRIVRDGDRLEVFAPYKDNFTTALRDFSGKRPVYDTTKVTRTGSPKFKCWSIREDDLDLMGGLLGWYFNGEAAIIEGRPVVLTRPASLSALTDECLSRKRSRKTAAKPKPSLGSTPANAPVVSFKPDPTTYGNYVQVFAPYHPDFTNGIKAIPRRKAIWDRGAKADGGDQFKCWAVPSSKKTQVIQLVADHFGVGAQIDDQT